MSIQKLKWVFLFVMILAFNPKQTHAMPILQTTGSPGSLILTGALGVTVGASLFDVEFLDGTCAGVFGSCETSSFTFDMSGAEAASNALFSQVFTDEAFNGLGDFDTDPDQTRGCELASSLNECGVLTPYEVILSVIGGSFAANSIHNVDDIVGFDGTPSLFDSGSLSDLTWARWTPVSVPEPGIVILTGSGLLVLFGIQRRNKKKI